MFEYTVGAVDRCFLTKASYTLSNLVSIHARREIKKDIVFVVSSNAQRLLSFADDKDAFCEYVYVIATGEGRVVEISNYSFCKLSTNTY